MNNVIADSITFTPLLALMALASLVLSIKNIKERTVRRVMKQIRKRDFNTRYRSELSSSELNEPTEATAKNHKNEAETLHHTAPKTVYRRLQKQVF